MQLLYNLLFLIRELLLIPGGDLGELVLDVSFVLVEFSIIHVVERELKGATVK